VKSGSYSVLDRAHVSKVLQEKEFQLSGMVKDTEIKQAGEYLGAEYVCVAQVSKVGSVYFISAKIINVETGEITAQSSDQRKGTIEVVFSLAQNVGRRLRGDEPTKELTEPVKTVEVEKEPEPRQVQQDESPSVEAPAKVSLGPRSHLMVSYALPAYEGDGVDVLDDMYSTFDLETKSWGIELQYMQILFENFYTSTGLLFGQRTDASQYWAYATPGEYLINFETVDFRLIAGYALDFGEIFQLYGGAGASYLSVVLNSDMWTPSLESSGLGFIIESGLDIGPKNFPSVGMRIAYMSAMLDEEIYTSEQSFGYFAISIGGGYAF
jgi:hypothetical protein